MDLEFSLTEGNEIVSKKMIEMDLLAKLEEWSYIENMMVKAMDRAVGIRAIEILMGAGVLTSGYHMLNNPVVEAVYHISCKKDIDRSKTFIEADTETLDRIYNYLKGIIKSDIYSHNTSTYPEAEYEYYEYILESNCCELPYFKIVHSLLTNERNIDDKKDILLKALSKSKSPLFLNIIIKHGDEKTADKAKRVLNSKEDKGELLDGKIKAKSQKSENKRKLKE